MSTDLDEVLDSLYLGSIEAALNTSVLKELGVTHILTIDNMPLSQEITNLFVTKYVHGLDLQDTDLLSHFDQCSQFIDEGRNAGAVLVHCQAGVSRSATVVTAYIMSKCQMELGPALNLVKKQRSTVRPNYGFLQQLQLYEGMGYHVDKNHDGFRMYKLNKLALRVQAGCYDGSLPPEIFATESEGHSSNTVTYKCRKCRTLLFHESVLLSHTVGEGEAAFDWRGKLPASKKPDQKKSLDVCEKSLFIEPVRWMAGSIETMEGKLSCPKCSSKIGSFIWYGERCPCGSWVAPAFHVQNSKVDRCTQRAPSRQPATITPRPTNSQQLPVMTNPGPPDGIQPTGSGIS